jgi:putative endonuclease
MRKKIGLKGELYAVHYLRSKGYEIVANNFYTRYGEIDIVAQKNNRFSFVEVKTRTSDYFGSPEEAISFIKIRRLKRTIMKFLLESPIYKQWQIDVIAIQLNSFEELVDLRHYKNVEFF